MDDVKVAIVTAAGRGIGAGIAKELHSQGYKLSLMSPSGASEKLAKDFGCVGITGSVTDQKNKIIGR